MDKNNRKFKDQLEINDLIDESINNALARRNQIIDANESLSDLSSEEAGNIVGGASTPVALKIICPPIIVGLIATDPDVLKA
ncbi:hypothetical protein I8751_14385 [Nostocaceae cyanobacterium CENA357]|uniref:Uncharacterized protein n=1 Tax=Atlanticothrix silvestris CENA357 TaxID=1725252 RepID=A0A8J7L5X2_9CYAN|nr:hypothetical protein [Atlanticothrix silvestris]MBH8553537.1 hypothetical protein [Atlanticothrix silvestris CENA357]